MRPEIGQKAPAINALNQKGENVTLDNFKGKKVVLYFYPKDNTPGCTAQACSLRDNYDGLLKQGYVILGVSIDDAKSHNKFNAKFELPFDILVDTEQKIVNDYGVWVEKSMYGKKYMGTARVTFVIDEQGIISEIIDKVDTKEHARQLLK
jgi:thioredoxin-dependent peroxiredoxin